MLSFYVKYNGYQLVTPDFSDPNSDPFSDPFSCQISDPFSDPHSEVLKGTQNISDPLVTLNVINYIWKKSLCGPI